MTTRITTENITDATIGTADLASSVPLNTQWQAVVTASTLTAVAGRGYFIDTTSNICTVTLPGSPSAGDVVVLKDYARTWGTNNVSTASALVDGGTKTNTFSITGQTVTLVYMDGTKGWSLVNEDTTSNLSAAFITATGGTVTTSDDFKIHTFTGDGCFAVSQAGNGSIVPAGGPSNVDYLVVAGGGAGAPNAGGGGGAGGYRTTFPSPGCNAGAFPITAQTYPITVGGGGAQILCGTPDSPALPGGVFATSGSNSVFSTITSTGGGGGGTGSGASGGAPGSPGGSGGGSWGSSPAPFQATGGSGNTPPVSPPQGNPAGNSASASGAIGSGGGGAGAAGANTSGNNSGAGGNGSASSITGSPITRGGGGGGGNDTRVGSAANGGTGGGGNGTVTGTATAGSVNTGGGGGGGGWNGGPISAGGAGGSGIVIIRYKFQ